MTRKFAGLQDYAVGKLEGQWFFDDDPAKVPKDQRLRPSCGSPSRSQPLDTRNRWCTRSKTVAGEIAFKHSNGWW